MSGELHIEKEAAMQKSGKTAIPARAQHVQRPGGCKELVLLKDKNLTMAGASEVK